MKTSRTGERGRRWDENRRGEVDLKAVRPHLYIPLINIRDLERLLVIIQFKDQGDGSCVLVLAVFNGGGSRRKDHKVE